MYGKERKIKHHSFCQLPCGADFEQNCRQSGRMAGFYFVKIQANGEAVMLILLIMAAGVFVGYFLLPKKLCRLNTWIQLGCTVVLVFCMGVVLGMRKNFWEELASLGFWSLLLAVLPMGCSAALVFLLTRFWEKWKEKKEES